MIRFRPPTRNLGVLMRLLAVCLSGLISTMLLAAPVPKDRPKTITEKLLGDWKLVSSSIGKGATTELIVTFATGGKITITQRVGNAPPFVRSGTYKVEGDKIHYEITTGGQKKETLTIKKLTADELAFTDPDNIKEEFERAKKTEKK
jgi:uncharacterized protein (TIGR03066 family)